MIARAAFGVGSAGAIALAARRANALDGAGAIAAWAVGSATIAGLGGPGAAVLLAFFVPAVALSRVGRARKRVALADVEKTGARDAGQVAANGAIAAFCALAALRVPRARLAFAGAFAAAAADTWGTEIGVLAKGTPVSIVTLQPVATGLSGGVTLAGTLAELAGTAAVAAVALALDRRAFWRVALAGFAGALADSILGGSLQALRRCPACERLTEREIHGCGTPTDRIRGLARFGNDGVNFVATATGAAVAFVLSPA